MKPIQVGGTLVIIIIFLSTFLPFSMADKVPDLQKYEMMSVRLPYNEDSVNFLRFIPPFSYRVFLPYQCLKIISLALISYGFF